MADSIKPSLFGLIDCEDELVWIIGSLNLLSVDDNNDESMMLHSINPPCNFSARRMN